MKRLTLLLIISSMVLLSVVYAQPVLQWHKQMDGFGKADQILATACDASNNVYVAGWVRNGTQTEGIVIKYSPSGEMQWHYNYTTGTNDQFNDIAVSGNYVYAVGRTKVSGYYNALAVRLNTSDGGLGWSKVNTWGTGYNNDARKLVLGPGDILYAGGATYKSGIADLLLLKYVPNGNTPITTYTTWDVSEASRPDTMWDMALSGDFVYYVGQVQNAAGNQDFYTGQFNTNFQHIWTRTYDSPGSGNDFATAITGDGAGNCYVTGMSSLGVNDDYYTIKYLQNGNSPWSATMNLNGNEHPFAIKLVGNNLYVGGTVSLPRWSAHVICYNATDGSTIWTTKASSYTGYITSAWLPLIVDTSGNVYQGGNIAFSGPPYIHDFALFQYAPGGTNVTIVSRDGYAGGLEDAPLGIASDGAGNIIMAGYATAATLVAPPNDQDLMTVKYYVGGTFLSQGQFAQSVAVSPVTEATAYRLNQNYPNPFNPSTTISFSLRQEGPVTITIYDALGRKVSTLLDHRHYSSGDHTIQFNAQGYSAGVYFYTIVSGAFAQTRKMVLVK